MELNRVLMCGAVLGAALGLAGCDSSGGSAAAEQPPIGGGGDPGGGDPGGGDPGGGDPGGGDPGGGDPGGGDPGGGDPGGGDPPPQDVTATYLGTTSAQVKINPGFTGLQDQSMTSKLRLAVDFGSGDITGELSDIRLTAGSDPSVILPVTGTVSGDTIDATAGGTFTVPDLNPITADLALPGQLSGDQSSADGALTGELLFNITPFANVDGTYSAAKQ